jgi:hypothetical protein
MIVFIVSLQNFFFSRRKEARCGSKVIPGNQDASWRAVFRKTYNIQKNTVTIFKDFSETYFKKCLQTGKSCCEACQK